MFPFQQGKELMIQFCSSPDHPQDLILQDHDHHAIPQISSASGSPPNIEYNQYLGLGDHSSTKKRGKRLCPQSSFNDHDNKDKDKKDHKMTHREIERQRRQEMATLYSKLRFLLPLEYIKGKRSISDHMNEAVKYIKDLQKDIKELESKRDELKKISNNLNHIDFDDKGGSSSASNSCCSFTLHETGSGVTSNTTSGLEIEFISSSRQQEGIPLSRILRLLMEEGLEIVNCVSTTRNGRSIYSIQSEVSNSTSVDLPDLRTKLFNVISSSNI